MTKARFWLILPIVFILSITLSVSLAETGQEKMMIGDHVHLGLLEQDGNEKNGKEPISWTVIDSDDNYCMLITDRIICHRAFDPSASSDTNWSNSALRSWMNTDLFNEIFSESEQAIIVPVKTDETEKYANRYEATDKIFLLSKEQSEHYMLRSEARVIPSEQSDFSLDKDAYHREEWWLRTTYSSTKKHKGPRGLSVNKLGSTIEMGKELGIRPVIVVQSSKIEARPLQLPERDEYQYLMLRCFDNTATLECTEKMLDKTIEYLSEHYNKAFRLKIRRSNNFTYYLVNTGTGETLSYDDRLSALTPSSYTISVEKDVNRFLKKNGFEEIDMSTAARGFFD